MPKRHALYDVHNTTPPPAHQPIAPLPQPQAVTLPDTPEYHTVPAWKDTSNRVRTWSLLDPNGEKIAEITTKRAAQQLATLLNRSDRAPSSPSPTV